MLLFGDGLEKIVALFPRFIVGSFENIIERRYILPNFNYF